MNKSHFTDKEEQTGKVKGGKAKILMIEQSSLSWKRSSRLRGTGAQGGGEVRGICSFKTGIDFEFRVPKIGFADLEFQG